MPQDKEYLLKEQEAAATYQGKLTAGQNIVIDQNNVISALGSTAPPTNVTVTPKTLSGENIADISVNGTTYSLFSSYPRTMTGATTASAGQSGYVPTPYLGSEDYVLYGSGEWKDPHVPVITANPAGSTTTLLNKLYLDGTIYGIAGGGGGSEVVECTQDEYDALPSSKLTDNKIYCISGTKVLDPNYEYHEYIDGQNGKIVVRIHGNVTEWFFMEWHQTAIAISFPTELEPYKPSNTEPILGANYPDGGTTQDGWIGFYDNSIRAWSQSTEDNVTGIKYGVVNINGESRQYIPYEDPYVWISSSIKKIVVNGTEYGNTGGGGGGGGETTKYYVTDGFLSDGTNRQFITVQLDEALTEGRGYIIAFKNEANGQIIAKSFFDYINDYNVTIGTASSIGNITLNITSTSISSTNYSGSWQDIYIDVYRTSSEGGTNVEANPSEESTDILDSIKIDDTVYAIAGGDGTEKVTDIMLPQNSWYLKNEYSMNVAWSNNEIVFTWDGGNNIGASAQRSVVIPAEIDKIRFKITTGTSYYSTYSALERFKVAVGLRATYDTSWVYPDPTYTSDWLALTNFATPNEVWEGELDTSSIDVDTYLYIMGHGWNMTINEVKTVKIEKNIEPNPEGTPTEVLHTLGINNTVYSIPGALQPITLTAAQYEMLPSSEKMDGSKIYFVTDE